MAHLRFWPLLLGALALAAPACTSILGDFTLSNGTTGTGGGTTTGIAGTSGSTTSVTTGAGGDTTSGTGGGATTSGTGGGTTSGTGGTDTLPCEVDADCQPLSKACLSATCIGQICEVAPVPAGQGNPPQIQGDCKKAECDGTGNVKTLFDDDDPEDDNNTCTTDTCSQGVSSHNPLSFGHACTSTFNPKAKVCNGAPMCVECNESSDCGGDVCFNNFCVAASCSDGAKNGNESDIDCGGTCAPCADGKVCMAPSECVSSNCDPVQHKCVPATCIDAIRNQNESDIDCGGTICAGCPLGKKCNVGSDCASAVCNGGICDFLVCDDGLMDGNETDVDCGGGQCMPCEAGKMCVSNADCLSGSCKPGFTCN